MNAQAKPHELVPAEPAALVPATILSVIASAAKDPSVDIDKLERLMAMHERMTARDAEAAFNKALTACQTEMRPISADAENPQTRSRYASFGQLDKSLRPIYTKHGFSLSFDEGDSPKPEHVRVLCYLSHIGGHTRTYHRDMPADGKGAKGGDVMTKTHAAGAAGSYGARYLLKGIFNVAIGEDDRDGNEPSRMPETEIAEWIVKIEATTTKEKAKEVWQEAMKAAQAAKDRYAAKTIKDKLIAHGEFIDKADKA